MIYKEKSHFVKCADGSSKMKIQNRPFNLKMQCSLVTLTVSVEWMITKLKGVRNNGRRGRLVNSFKEFYFKEEEKYRMIL